MTREEQDAERDLERSEGRFLSAYGWRCSGGRWSHPRAPKLKPDYVQRDALVMTRAQKLRYSTVANRAEWPEEKKA